MFITRVVKAAGCAVVAAQFAMAPANASPYVPADGAQVLERLPSRNDPAQRELRQLRTALAASPEDVPTAVALARRYIETARRTGEPRYLGYAQATLSPWWNQPQAPHEVKVLRATVWQSQHQFSRALSDLDDVVKANPRNAQAWLTRATILPVQGEYEKARQSCARLHGLASELVVSACLSGANALGPNAMQSYVSLDAALKKHPNAEPGIKAWALTLLGEMAARENNPSAAEHHFRQALSIDSADIYLLGAYADFLLDAGREAEVVPLLASHHRTDGLLLRHTLALRKLRSPIASRQIDILQSRFDAAMLRGDTVHEREQARFELHLRDNPRSALVHAQDNWNEQKEFADARLLLEAAAASNDKAAAAPVLNWLRQNRIDTPLLANLAAKLESQ
ncbi:hypothetical protein RY831_01150 [Noviherbaspirillum sp. CPCC 100848]|uniref:Tetratricopeptide repeat protein n=1 Tax=Noviherbaspirillum album TaxID=3080276 RepID=A0ABU6J296_9BURK|nr:hypothetical protein [Noviherbaspirillum sp. CPCC 100848]MEC4717744.1 hypothetical protein [Noviherbaspirillum sp. CPCC 100848]